jgi:hypothetical protein
MMHWPNERVSAKYILIGKEPHLDPPGSSLVLPRDGLLAGEDTFLKAFSLGHQLSFWAAFHARGLGTITEGLESTIGPINSAS